MAEILRVDPANPDPAAIARAAAAIRAGELVGLPTETVYGLAANAFDPAAVARVFAAKGRPADNPLICHISSASELSQLAAEIPPLAEPLIAAFWPGPLSIIFRARPEIPAITLGGLGTVSIRLPASPVARAVIAAAGVPLAAPSANRSGSPSPTLPSHVAADLGDSVSLILDAGPSQVGLESTVLDLSTGRPIVARLGGLPVESIEQVIGPVEIRAELRPGQAPISPGQKYRHYSPRAELILATGNPAEQVEKIRAELVEFTQAGRRAAVLVFAEDSIVAELRFSFGSRAEPADLAATLFANLRAADLADAEIIIAASPADSAGLNAASLQRLRKAASRII